MFIQTLHLCDGEHCPLKNNILLKGVWLWQYVALTPQHWTVSVSQWTLPVSEQISTLPSQRKAWNIFLWLLKLALRMCVCNIMFFFYQNEISKLIVCWLCLRFIVAKIINLWDSFSIKNIVSLFFLLRKKEINFQSLSDFLFDIAVISLLYLHNLCKFDIKINSGYLTFNNVQECLWTFINFSIHSSIIWWNSSEFIR